MAKTLIQPGHILTLIAAAAVTAGTPVLYGTLIVVPMTGAALGETFEGMISGVHSVTKAASQAWTVGAAVYWDNTAKNFTTVSAGNTLAGVAVEAVGSGAGETTGKVLLNGNPGC